MGERTRIGFYYIWDKSWMGGVIYAQNLLKAINMLDDIDKPIIDVYCRSNEAYDDLKDNTDYPYLDKVIIHDHSLWNKGFKTIVQYIFGADIAAKINRFRIKPEDEMVFPYGYGSNKEKLVYWRPDFQDKYLPELFTQKELAFRDSVIRTVSKRGIPLVFSSYDSEKDFKRFYPEYHNKTFVVHFAVDHADFSSVDINKVKTKYGIKGEYFLCANQFWKHKNHLFLLKAYDKALRNGLRMQLVCTGKMSDYRNPDYIDEIKNYIEDNNLYDHVILPGLIDSKELHCLMKNSYAVVQPSLFEGWNTTVEDCKALNKFIFLSNLPVHREQAKANVCFFDPRDEEDLSMKLLSIKPTNEPFDYSNNLREFGQNFLDIVKYVKNQCRKE